MADEKPDEKGAPANFGGPVLSNPDNVRPKLDTEGPDTETPTGATFHADNPPAADLSGPKPHPMDLHTAKPKSVRHPLGSRLPRQHVLLSDN